MIGREIARDLASDPDPGELLIADRDLPGAGRIAAALNRAGARAVAADVSDRPALVRLLSGADVTISAVQYNLNLEVMAACLEAGTHYVDLGGLFHTTRRQLALDEAFHRAGLLAILGLGSCPGVANIQARALADRLDRLHSIRIYNGSTSDAGDSLAWGYSIRTILDEMTSPAMVFRDGRYHEAPALGEEERYRFEDPIGETTVHLSLHSEVATLPLTFADKGIRECVFKIARFGFSEKAFERLRGLVELGFASTEPIPVGEMAVAPRELLIRLLERVSSATPASNPGFKEIVTEGRGERQGRGM